MDAILNTLSDKGRALRTPSGTGLPLVAGSRQARERKDGLRHIELARAAELGEHVLEVRGFGGCRKRPA